MNPERGEFLVIGFGSDLRSDDAIGPAVARAVGELGLPRVRSLDVTQLTPELAEAIAGAAAVVFVDATIDAVPGGVLSAPVAAAALDEPIGHLGNPRSLLALAEALFHRAAPAWLVRIGVGNLELGDRLSPVVEAAVPAAVEVVRTLIDRAGKADLVVDANSGPHDHGHAHPHNETDFSGP